MGKLQILMIISLLLHITTPSKLGESTYHNQLIGLRLTIICRDSPILYPAYTSKLQSFPILSTTITPRTITPFRNNGNFFTVQLCIGDPIQYVYLNLDTAMSPLTWTQCRGHGKHIKQEYPKQFDQQKSRSYQKVPHNSSICKNPIFRKQNRDCVYNFSYRNGGSTSGVASYERFQFMTIKNSTTYVSKIIFGCATQINNINYGPGSGTLSMNKSPESLVTQLSSTVGWRFSYCLVLSPRIRTFLRFGNDILKGRGKVQKTPLVQHLYYPYAYAVDLIDISLGSLQLKISKDGLANTRRDSGFLIDTNTIVTNINRGVYTRIRKVLAHRFDKLRLRNTSVADLDLCYEMKSGLKLKHVIVPMTFHFGGGADLRIPAEKVFVLNKSKSCFCLGLKATNGPNVLGAMQQHNTRFTFDIEKGMVSFSQEDCISRDKVRVS